MMLVYLVAYAVTALTFIGVDAVWLGIMAKLLYRPLLGGMLLDKFNPLPAVAFYAIYIGGIVFFASTPAIQSGQWTTAMLRGAVLGFVAYATYDLTNMATLKGWPAIITVADLAWGTIATSIAASVGYLVVKAVFK